MKKFMAVFTGGVAARERSGWDTISEADRKTREQAGIAAWGAWMIKNQASIVDGGAPLGKTKRTGLNGVTDIKNNLAPSSSCRRTRTRPPRDCSKVTRTSRSFRGRPSKSWSACKLPGSKMAA